MRVLCGSPGGKYRVAKQIIQYFPDHKVFCEVFAGSAAVFFAKKPSEKEVLNDLDEYSSVLKFLKTASAETIESLKRMNWNQNKELWLRLKESKPVSDLDRFRRFVYVTRWSYNKERKGFSNATDPADFNLSKFQAVHDRLQNVTILKQDYTTVVRDYDGPDTLHYLDPPYHDDWTDKQFVASETNPVVKDWFTMFTGGLYKFDLDKFITVLKGIRGKFVCSYSSTPENIRKFKGFQVKKLSFVRQSAPSTSEGFRKKDTEILVFNYSPMLNSKYLYDEGLEDVDFGEHGRWDNYISLTMSDRYSTLGIAHPNLKTMCLGQCEGTGWVPVYKDEQEEPFKTLWQEAEKKEPSKDGWHFVVCPDCHGTRMRN